MQNIVAQIYWADVQAIYPDKDEAWCKRFLDRNGVYIEEAMVEAGQEVIPTLVRIED